LDKETREEISEAFRDFIGINERRKLGVENNGLCLLIVYTQKIIKEKARNLRKFQELLKLGINYVIARQEEKEASTRFSIAS